VHYLAYQLWWPIASNDDADHEVDFQLVSTYSPLLIILLRSVVLVVMCEIYTKLMGPRQNLLVVLIVWMYCDAYLWRTDKINRALGFLCPVGMCILTTTDFTHCSALVSNKRSMLAQGVYWTVQVIWPLLAAYYLAVLVLVERMQVKSNPSEIVLAAASMFCLMVHCVLLLSAYQTAGEVMLRSVLYYTAGMIFFHSKSKLQCSDRNTHNWMAMHVCLHILFVDVYVLIASCVVFSGLFWRLFAYQTGTLPRPGGASTASPQSIVGLTGPTPACPGKGIGATDESTMQQLRAAQAQRTSDV
jgi:hypothetical protein